jgi:hypothetical protein
MKSLFEPTDRNSIVTRLQTLRPDSARQWGKMSVAQMLRHCAIALESGTGDRPMKQALIGKILMPFFKSSLLGEKPFQKGSPTDPTFVVTNDCDFDEERNRLTNLIERFVSRGPDAAAMQTHSFFGKLTGEQWGRLMYKHIDHHLQQFGA